MFKYSIVLQWSDEDDAYIALIPEMPTVSAFGDTPEEAAREVQVAAGLYLDFLNDEGLPPPLPYLLPVHSGQLRLRMPRRLHTRLALQAQVEGVSLNTYILHLLGLNSGHHETASTAENKISNNLKQVSSPGYLVREDSVRYRGKQITRQRSEKRIPSKANTKRK